MPVARPATNATAAELAEAVAYLFDNGYVYHADPGVELQATTKGFIFHAALTGATGAGDDTAEDIAADLLGRQIDANAIEDSLRHPTMYQPHDPDRPRRGWPAGQGQRPGMIDRSPEGRRLGRTLIALGVLVLAGGAVLALIIYALK